MRYKETPYGSRHTCPKCGGYTLSPGALCYRCKLVGKNMELTPTQHETACLFAMGHTIKEIADQRQCSRKTVEKHIQTTYHKLGLHCQTHLAHWAIVRGHIQAVDRSHPTT